MKHLITILILILTAAMLTGCAAQANGFENTADPEGEIAGFWQGIWHGIITPVTFVISLFSDKVGFYELYNNGNWYNFGYIIGLSIIFGGSSKGTCKKKRS